MVGRILAVTLCFAGIASAAGAPAAPAAPANWSMNATIIEACSCPLFCQCYFNTMPAEGHEHGGEMKHFCRFNNAYKVNKGTYGTVKLDGAKFWVSGDLGGDFSQGNTDWAVVTFDKSTSKEQREAIGTILGRLYPVKWGSLTTAEGNIAWESTKEGAHATIDDGKTAEVKLKKFPGMTAGPVVIKNLKYFGADTNDGFVLMPNEVEAYRVGDKAYEFKGSNGFMITLSIASKPPAKKSTGKTATGA
jgi:hypothetical protein